MLRGSQSGTSLRATRLPRPGSLPRLVPTRARKWQRIRTKILQAKGGLKRYEATAHSLRGVKPPQVGTNDIGRRVTVSKCRGADRLRWLTAPLQGLSQQMSAVIPGLGVGAMAFSKLHQQSTSQVKMELLQAQADLSHRLSRFRAGSHHGAQSGDPSSGRRRREDQAERESSAMMSHGVQGGGRLQRRHPGT